MAVLRRQSVERDYEHGRKSTERRGRKYKRKGYVAEQNL